MADIESNILDDGTVESKEESGPRRRYSRSAKQISSLTVPKGFSGMPDMMCLKMIFVDSGSFISAVNPSPSPYVYQPNSIFEPNVTTSGAKPAYYNQMAAIYGRYLVYGVEWEVTMLNNSTTPAWGVVAFNTEYDTSPSVGAYSEFKYATLYTLGGVNADTAVVTKRGYMSSAKMFGQDYMDEDPRKYSLLSTSPTDGYYMYVRAETASGTSINIFTKTRLTFYVKLKDLQEPAQST